MIEPGLAWGALTAALTLASTAAAWTVSARRTRVATERDAEEVHGHLLVARDAAERRARELATQNATWRASTLAPRDLPANPVFRERMAPIEHGALVAMLEGLTLVDDAAIADASGLPRTRETDLGTAAIAALAGPVESLRVALAALGAGVAEVRLETLDAIHVTARILHGRAEGSMLVVKSTSLRANPLAIDAVAHVAAGDNGEPRGVSEPLGSVRSSSWRGSSNRGSSSHNPPGDARLFDELQRELDRAGVRALVFGVRGQLELSAADDGPSESVRAATFEALEMFQKRAARLLHGAGMAHVDVTLANSGAVRWSSVSRDSSLVMVADDGNTSPALVERLSGRLRRSREAANASGDGVSRSLS